LHFSGAFVFLYFEEKITLTKSNDERYINNCCYVLFITYTRLHFRHKSWWRWKIYWINSL